MDKTNEVNDRKEWIERYETNAFNNIMLYGKMQSISDAASCQKRA